MRTAHPELLQTIAQEQALSDEVIEQLRAAADSFKAGSQWASSGARTAA
jgi:hypothetical protein